MSDEERLMSAAEIRNLTDYDTVEIPDPKGNLLLARVKSPGARKFELLEDGESTFWDAGEIINTIGGDPIKLPVYRPDLGSIRRLWSIDTHRAWAARLAITFGYSDLNRGF